MTWALAILFIHSFYDANLRSLLAKKQFEPPIDNIEDLYYRNKPYYIDRLFIEHQRRFLGQSGIAVRRELFKKAEENLEKQSFMRDRGQIPKSLYEDLIRGEIQKLKKSN